MNATNLTLHPVELSGGRMLQVDETIEDFEVTDHERALADAGTIALIDAAGRRRAGGASGPDPAGRQAQQETEAAQEASTTPTGGEQ